MWNRMKYERFRNSANRIFADPVILVILPAAGPESNRNPAGRHGGRLAHGRISG